MEKEMTKMKHLLSKSLIDDRTATEENLFTCSMVCNEKLVK